MSAANTVKSSSSTKRLSALVLALPARGIAHSCKAMSPIREPLASVKMSSTTLALSNSITRPSALSAVPFALEMSRARRGSVSRARPSNGDPSIRHCTGISRLALKPNRSVFRSLQHVSSLQAGSFRAHLSHESSRAPSH